MSTGKLEVKHPGQQTPNMTVCALLYGDYPALAQRCLSSILTLPTDVEVRIGMNACSNETRDYVMKVHSNANQVGRSVLLYDSSLNRGKYAMMRWMFHDSMCPLTSRHVMWFDDDSYISYGAPEWLDRIKVVISTEAMCGFVMQCYLAGDQHLWIQMQRWYKGKPVLFDPVKDRFYIPKFAVGGRWVMRTDTIKALDWPPRNIVHRGGDFMLGEALRQNDMRVVHYFDRVTINSAIGSDKHHTAVRRGLNPLPIGVDYAPPLSAQLHFATKEIDPTLLDYPGL